MMNVNRFDRVCPHWRLVKSKCSNDVFEAFPEQAVSRQDFGSDTATTRQSHTRSGRTLYGHD